MGTNREHGTAQHIGFFLIIYTVAKSILKIYVKKEKHRNTIACSRKKLRTALRGLKMIFYRIKIGFLLILTITLCGCAGGYAPYTGINTSKPLETVVSLSDASIDANGNIRVQLVRYTRYEQYYFSPHQVVEKPTGTYQIAAKDLYTANAVMGGWQVEGLSRGTIKINTDESHISLNGILKKDSNKQIRLVCLGCSSDQDYYGHKITKEVTLDKTEGEIYKVIAESNRLRIEANKARDEYAANYQKQVRIKFDKASREGDGSSDDLKCKSFGFKFGTKDYGDCRIRLDTAQTQNAEQQRVDQLKQQQFEAEMAEKKRALDAQINAQNKQRQLQAGQALLNYSSSLANPAPATQTYIMPSGKAMNCTTTGTITNCL